MARRRAVIRTTGVGFFGALAGCSSESNPFGSNSDSTQEVIDASDTVAEGRYLIWKFSLPSDALVELDVTVQSGPHLDIVFTGQEMLQDFEDGNNIEYRSELSLVNSTGGRNSGDVPAGDYVVIVDNSDRLEARPPENFEDDPARVEVSLIVEGL